MSRTHVAARREQVAPRAGPALAIIVRWPPPSRARTIRSTCLATVTPMALEAVHAAVDAVLHDRVRLPGGVRRGARYRFDDRP